MESKISYTHCKTNWKLTTKSLKDYLEKQRWAAIEKAEAEKAKAEAEEKRKQLN